MQHSPCNHHILNLFNNYPSHLPPSPTPLSLSTELHISQIPHRPPPPSPTPPPPSTWYLEETLKLKCQLRFHEYTKHWNLKHFTVPDKTENAYFCGWGIKRPCNWLNNMAGTSNYTDEKHISVSRWRISSGQAGHLKRGVGRRRCQDARRRGCRQPPLLWLQGPPRGKMGSTRFALCESSDQMAKIQIAQRCNFIQTELTVKQMLRWKEESSYRILKWRKHF